MMWDHVMERIVTLILADPVLAGIFGDHLRMAGSGKSSVPSIEYTLITDTEGELWTPISIQFDLWTTSAVDSRTAERKLRGLLHHDLPQSIDGLTLWTTYTDGSPLATPDRSNFVGRALRFHFTPLREQYAAL
jgi:hypothetical protein